MAPLTRRRAKAAETSFAESVDTPETSQIIENEVSTEKPVAKRNKRSSSSSNDKDGGSVEEESTEITTPKRKRLAVRTREEENASGGRKMSRVIEVQIPTSSAARSRADAVADSQAEDDESDGPQATGTQSEPQSASKQLEEEASQKLASQSVEPEPTPQPKARSSHVVFGDDSDVDKFVTAATAAETAKEPQAESEEEDGDSDDEAPEAVSTQVAAKKGLEAAQAAVKAAAEHDATQKRKRQERDNLFREQAQKRQRIRRPHQIAEENDGDNAQKLGRKGPLPDVLPAELLTDSSDESEDGSALKAVKKPKKTNFEDVLESLGKESKRPRDEIIGGTRYRVLAQKGDQSLAPKMNKNSRIVKEDMLKRKRLGIQQNKKKGFFVKR
ncbi:hypothetical protein F5Y15DRAFT_298583 [Xylariaceae sp. FL0016]|nr:hypothetical protein F5Y15DRAFT_298583 [Xylariaceae sp. FL0016]